MRNVKDNFCKYTGNKRKTRGNMGPLLNEGHESVPSASLLMTENWADWLIHQRAMLPSRGTLTGWRNGLTRTS